MPKMQREEPALTIDLDENRTATLDAVRRYYGDTLNSSEDLQTNACCAIEAPDPHIARALANVHDEVQSRFYGCGSPIPLALEGMTVLDLGCGSGRDAYILSQLVGPKGAVIGLDMTEAQLAVARRHRDHHARAFGYANVEFRTGFIEDLKTARIEDSSVDVVISNCVINLSPDKRSVFKEIFRVLKPGGELIFADIFADRRIPSALGEDPVLRGECLGGALYWEDFRRLMADCGCADMRTLSNRAVEIDDPDMAARVGHIGFSSVTVRAFKLDLEDRCEDYGQAVRYKGTVPEAATAFVLDDHHRFEAGKVEPVCGNTVDMLSRTRYSRHFEVIGGRDTHFGLFDCGPTPVVSNDESSVAGCC